MRAETLRETILPETLCLQPRLGRHDLRPNQAGADDLPTALDRAALELLVRRPRRRILVVEGAAYSGRSLASILGRWSFDVVTVRGEDVGAGASIPLDRADLVVVALPDTGAVALLAVLRALPALAETPILAVAGSEVGSVDCDELRNCGVVGVMQRATSPEHVAFRVGQILPLGSMEERRHVRVPVELAVEIETNGVRTRQRAENLSLGGIRLRSSVELEVNALVALRFRLPMHPTETLAVEARVIHCEPAGEGEASFTAGLFFRSISPRGRTLVEVEIVRLLTGAVIG